jgi:hypothetical protein
VVRLAELATLAVGLAGPARRADQRAAQDRTFERYPKGAPWLSFIAVSNRYDLPKRVAAFTLVCLCAAVLAVEDLQSGR